jgi:hypothetical protein
MNIPHTPPMTQSKKKVSVNISVRARVKKRGDSWDSDFRPSSVSVLIMQHVEKTAICVGFDQRG